LGFQIETKFRAGPARAAWITNSQTLSTFHTQNNTNTAATTATTATPATTIKGQNDIPSRLELIEVPSYILNEPNNQTRKRSFDLFTRQDLLGLNHYALDVTAYISHYKQQYRKEQDTRDNDDDEYYGLDQFLQQINNQSIKTFGKTLRVALQPEQKVIGSQVYEMAYIYDADGSVIELLRYIKELNQPVTSGWEPWDGRGFVGTTSSSTSS